MKDPDFIAGVCLFVSVAISMIGLSSTLIAAFEENERKEKDSHGFSCTVRFPRTFKQKCWFWLLGILFATFWTYGTFIIYGIYFVGAKVVASVNHLERSETVVPKTPEVIDLNKPEKTK